MSTYKLIKNFRPIIASAVTEVSRNSGDFSAVSGEDTGKTLANVEIVSGSIDGVQIGYQNPVSCKLTNVSFEGYPVVFRNSSLQAVVTWESSGSRLVCRSDGKIVLSGPENLVLGSKNLNDHLQESETKAVDIVNSVSAKLDTDLQKLSEKVENSTATISTLQEELAATKLEVQTLQDKVNKNPIEVVTLPPVEEEQSSEKGRYEEAGGGESSGQTGEEYGKGSEQVEKVYTFDIFNFKKRYSFVKLTSNVKISIKLSDIPKPEDNCIEKTWLIHQDTGDYVLELLLDEKVRTLPFEIIYNGTSWIVKK